jgi:hypothetical protein
MTDEGVRENSSLVSKMLTGSVSSKRRSTRLSYSPVYEILATPSHKASVVVNLQRIPQGSSALSPNSKKLEQQWDNRFNVVFSKNNNEFYTTLKEYFDSPRKFEEKIPRKQIFHKSPSPKKRYRRKTAYDKKESMWDTRYSSSSESNEVKHKLMRNYFISDKHRH